MPISTDLRPYLDRWTPPPSDHGWCFPSPQGRRWDPDNFSADLRDVGVPWTCLDFRHSFGSHLAQNEISLSKIAQLMGNSPAICRRHYAALVTEAMAHDISFRRDHSLHYPVVSQADILPSSLSL